MAFIGIQPGREPLFQPAPRRPVAVNDAAAWRLNPMHRQVYDRLQLALSAGLCAAPCGVPPADYGLAPQTELFVKPIINLSGMALGARAVLAGEVPQEPGSFWCERLQGEQSSSDCLVERGEPRWFAHTRAAAERSDARPLYWEVGADMPQLEPILTGLVRQHLPGYSGLCNIELIGGRPVEMHLRGSNGFFDFYGPEFIAAWVDLVDGRRFQPPPPIPGGFVISVFGTGRLDARAEQVAEAAGVSVQPDPHTHDRLAILRTCDLDAGLRVQQALINAVTSSH
ncbi:hypothetical protein [Rhabdochromatium marinum]|uniref:hypothetical protein n=1 Tax=Rhabdochromatium marinum TaxID=48729 RepID=UPI001903C758|nr:hypothetical protein [Rhabdochromatium marinum]MBK1647829.1 hypothetical protein [Rhabdochromatium marinum]